MVETIVLIFFSVTAFLLGNEVGKMGGFLEILDISDKTKSRLKNEQKNNAQ